MNNELIVSHINKIPDVIPEGIVKLRWNIELPLPRSLPESLKILIAKHVVLVNYVPRGLVYLEVGDSTIVILDKIPPTCHIERINSNPRSTRYQNDNLTHLLKLATKKSIIERIKLKLKFIRDLFLWPN